jgi:hypothetical protein
MGSTYVCYTYDADGLETWWRLGIKRGHATFVWSQRKSSIDYRFNDPHVTTFYMGQGDEYGSYRTVDEADVPDYVWAGAARIALVNGDNNA